MRSRERPPEVVRLRVDEITELTVSALERGDLDPAAEWLGLVLTRNDPTTKLGRHLMMKTGGGRERDDGVLPELPTAHRAEVLIEDGWPGVRWVGDPHADDLDAALDRLGRSAGKALADAIERGRWGWVDRSTDVLSRNDPKQDRS